MTVYKHIALIIKRVCLAGWAAILACCLLFYVYDPHQFTARNIAEFLLLFENEVLALYIVSSILRGFTLLPSTPLVIAGTILYPDAPVTVLVISLGGILLSSSMIYFFSDLLGFSEFLEQRDPERYKRLRATLERPTGVAFVFLWAFFPLVPTDAVCYLAGTIRMAYWKFISAIFLGELLLCSIYIYSGGHIARILGV